jgi:putative FmdB family regulatory protein
MPIYEFYCAHCHRIYSFLSRTIQTSKVPPCPACAAPDLRRRASAFAISKNRPEKDAADDGMPDFDETRLDAAMESLAGEIDGVDENDPRQAARVMRRVFEATGMPVAGGMEEALRRMEAGEDPDRIEEDLGDVMDADPFAGGEPKKGTKAFRRRWLPPSVDPKLYEM